MIFRKRCAPRFHAECTGHCVESFHEEPIREKNVIFKIQGPKSRVQNPDPDPNRDQDPDPDPDLDLDLDLDLDFGPWILLDSCSGSEVPN